MKPAWQHHLHRGGRVARRLGRWMLYAGAAGFALLLVLYVAARALLPGIESRKGELEEYLTRMSAHTVRIEKLAPYWDGLLPGVHIEGLKVYASDAQRPSVRLGEVHASLAPFALLRGRIDIHNLVLTRPSVTLERLDDGRLRISGFEAVDIEQDGGADEKFADWLLRQRKLVIRDGELQWIDHRDRGERVHLTHVQFYLRNRGDRHRADLNAKFPAALCGECAVTLDVTGNPLAGADWKGKIDWRAVGLNVERLPRIARERMPQALRGTFDVRLRSEWDNGMPKHAHGVAAVAGLRVPLAGLEDPVAIKQASAEVSWKLKDGGWQLDLTQVTLALKGRPWTTASLRLTRVPGEHALQARHIDLADVSGFVAALNAAHPVLRDWSAIRPGGALDNVTIHIVGDLQAPAAFSAHADIRRLSTEPYGKLPGVDGLSGRLALTQHGGELVLDATDITLNLPNVFRGPIDAQRVGGVLAWRRAADHWRVDGADLRVVSADGSGTGNMQLVLPVDREQSPHLKLRVDFRDGNGANAARYYPAPHLPPRTLAWMDSAFLGGTITNGYVIYDGAVRAFPFRDGDGRFEIRGHVREGVYRYLSGWTPITHADVDVAITGEDVVITGRGKIGTLDATQVAVRTRLAESGAGRVVAVSGNVHGAIAESLRVLRAVETPAAARWRHYVPTELRAEGAGHLSLDIAVALPEHEVTVAGEYRVKDATLRFPSTGIAVTAVTGHTRFTEEGIAEARFAARTFGGDAVATVSRGTDGRLALDARGRVAAAAVARLQSVALSERASGGAEWSLAWRERAGLGELKAEAALDQIKTRLPPPLDRPDGLLSEKLVVHTEESRPDSHVLDVRAGDAVRGKLAFARDREAWRFAGGHIAFGLARAALPASGGLQLSARLGTLDVDQWLPFSGDRSETPPLFKHVTAEIKQFDMFDRHWGRVFIDLTAADRGWRALLDGDAAAGRATFLPARPAARRPMGIDLDLSYLRLPEKKHKGQDTPIDPAQLPAIDVSARAFEYRDRRLGELDFSAAPVERGWRIARASLTRPEMKLTASGVWRATGERHASEFDIEFSGSDMGKTLEAFGASGQLAGGKAEIRAHLAWPGSPTNVKVAGLTGRVEIAAEKGRFLQFDPGAARLFGLLDLNSIARYLTLDFTSAFGRGFTYDKIHGTVTLQNGNAHTGDLIVKSPSAGLAVEGRVGLAAEDYDLTLGITPKLSDTLTFTSWGLFGPQAAAAVLALQKIFRKQIAKGTRVTYVVKGPWSNPNVTKVVKEPQNAAPPG